MAIPSKSFFTRHMLKTLFFTHISIDLLLFSVKSFHPIYFVSLFFKLFDSDVPWTLSWSPNSWTLFFDQEDQDDWDESGGQVSFINFRKIESRWVNRLPLLKNWKNEHLIHANPGSGRKLKTSELGEAEKSKLQLYQTVVWARLMIISKLTKSTRSTLRSRLHISNFSKRGFY